MATKSKKDLCDKIAETYHFQTKLTKEIVQLFLDEIITELEKGNRLEFREFGVFEHHSRAARLGHNPKTLEKVHVPPKRTIKFRPGRKMKQSLNEEKGNISSLTDRIKQEDAQILIENDNVDTSLPETLPKKGIVKEMYVVLSKADEAMSSVELFEAIKNKLKKASLGYVCSNLSIHKDLFYKIMKKDLTQDDSRKPGWIINKEPLAKHRETV